MNLGYLFHNAVARFSQHIAAYDEKRSLTFCQLNERVNRLGNLLASQGIAYQDRIASLQYNGIETLEFDVMAAKFGYVRSMLNARGSVADHIDQLNLSNAKFLLLGSEFLEHADEIRRNVPSIISMICVGGDDSSVAEYEEQLAGADAAEPSQAVSESDWHSIYFTSGSTGRPKGIVLSQGNWLAVVRNHLTDTYAATNTTDVLLHAAPMSHASGSLVFAHLMRGARQTFIKRFDPAHVLQAFEREGATTVWLAPTMLIKLLEHEDSRSRNLSTLRSVRFGGAPMAADRIREAVGRWGPVFCSGWGQWEAPQQCTFFSQRQIAEAVSSHHSRLTSVGLPVNFAKVAIADDDGNLLPAGNEGEVVVAGDHLMVGYLDKPKETADIRFREWQRTGDIGRIDKDGFVYLTDRKRDIIISGGSNIFPREIEEVLYAHPAILEAVVIGIPDSVWGETVHGVAVLRKGKHAEAAALLAWCRERLPSYKRLRSIEFVDELPKSSYGKILRRDIRDRYRRAQGLSN